MDQQPGSDHGDYRSRPRWSAGKKMDAVLRLLRGEPLETPSRELGVEAHRLAAWARRLPGWWQAGAQGQRPDRSPDDRALRQAERKIRQLTMENEILRAAAGKGGPDPAGEAAQIAMAHRLPVAVVCQLRLVVPLRQVTCLRSQSMANRLRSKPSCSRTCPTGVGRQWADQLDAVVGAGGGKDVVHLIRSPRGWSTCSDLREVGNLS
jgi:transposase-like protein